MTNEEKANELIAGDEGINISTVRLLIKDKVLQMAEWKDEQYRIDKTHLNMIYEALNRLYQVRYGDKPILNTGSQTDVFLYMIEDIINDIKSK